MRAQVITMDMCSMNFMQAYKPMNKAYVTVISTKNIFQSCIEQFKELVSLGKLGLPNVQEFHYSYIWSFGFIFLYIV